LKQYFFLAFADIAYNRQNNLNCKMMLMISK